jgi:hypothetical protein
VSLGIFSEACDGTMCPGVDPASKNEYEDTPGSKAGRCVRLTTYHLHVPNVKKIRGLKLPDPHGPVQACRGTALLDFTYSLLCKVTKYSGIVMQLYELNQLIQNYNQDIVVKPESTLRLLCQLDTAKKICLLPNRVLTLPNFRRV